MKLYAMSFQIYFQSVDMLADNRFSLLCPVEEQVEGQDSSGTAAKEDTPCWKHRSQVRQ
jgi:hypothetical protein